MFGTYNPPFTLEQDGITISCTKEGDGFFYQRTCLDKTEERVLMVEKPTVLINPVEPVNKPKNLSPYAMVEFSKPLIVEPRGSKHLFLSFPVETGVFVSSSSSDFESIDIFTLNTSKFSLYGDPRSGLICKYWKSDVYVSLPYASALLEGAIELGITNTLSDWVTVTKAVFNAYGMKIFYNDALVYMKAEMEITGTSSARTDFYETPWELGMKKSLELYTARKLPITTTKFSMEYGI